MATERRLIDANALLPNGVFYVNGNDPMTSLDELLRRIANAPHRGCRGSGAVTMS